MPDYLSIARKALETSKAIAGPKSLESVMGGVVIELWSDTIGVIFIVADENDVRRLGEPRGTTYTVKELRRVLQITDPLIVGEIHQWKRKFNGRIRGTS